MAGRINLVENYIYFYHILDKNGNGTFMVLPTIPDQITENLSSNFSSTSILSRTAPIQTYSDSGPRTVQFSLDLHRDIMYDLNYSTSNIKLEIGEDYVDKLCNYLQTVALPTYAATNKMVNPPLIAVRFGNDTFIKGIVNGGIGTTKQLPLLADGRYSRMNISFTVTEVDPYDAKSVIEQGSLRGLSTSLNRFTFGGNR